MRGQNLMPCSQRKARILLKNGKVKIYSYNPFTIQLLYTTGETSQKCNVGIDTGSKHIGFAITSENKVFSKGEIELRQDVKKNIDKRRAYRRDRRNRKTRYREVRFQNRVQSKHKGWLPPSINSKINHTFNWIDKLCNLISNCTLHIEVGKFDTVKIINPNIQGKEYQQGNCFGYFDVRYFVFARDNYTCQCCGKSKEKILNTHHIIFRSNGGTDRADNLITICTDCHTAKNHKKGGILYKWQEEHKKVKQYKEPPFMNIVRKKIFNKYLNAIISYGSETTPKRKDMWLEKTHYNDAIVISGITKITENPNEYLLIKQFRKKKRSLHESIARKGRKEPNRTQKRNSKNTPFYKGFYMNDYVKVFNQKGYISGFASGGAYVKNSDDNYITMIGKRYKQIGIKNLEKICHNNNWQFYIISDNSSHD